MQFSKKYLYGNSRKKVEDLSLSLEIEEEDGIYKYNMQVAGPIDFERELEESDLFSALNTGMAGLRQSLRRVKEENPKIKFYEKIEDELVEQTIEDIFWTHDCVSDEMVYMMEWAKSNGYKSQL